MFKDRAIYALGDATVIIKDSSVVDNEALNKGDDIYSVKKDSKTPSFIFMNVAFDDDNFVGYGCSGTAYCGTESCAAAPTQALVTGLHVVTLRRNESDGRT